MSLSSWIQIGMFCVAFGIMWVAFTQDPLGK